MRSFLLTLAFAVAATTATHLRLHIPPSNHLPNPAVLPPSTSATLTTLSKTYTAPLDTSNSFSFRNVTPGSYLVDIHSSSHSFAPLRIDVTVGSSEAEGGADGGIVIQAWGTFRGNEWDNKGEVLVVSESVEGDGAKVVEVVCTGGKNYYQERSGFSPLSLLKNPMILLGGVSMLIVFGMPYLMDNMDPEMRAEFEERQKQSPVSGLLAGQQPGQSPLANFDAAAWLAGSSKKEGGAGPQERGVSR